jgi:hypothetical protein
MPRVRWITSRAILSEPKAQEIALKKTDYRSGDDGVPYLRKQALAAV